AAFEKGRAPVMQQEELINIITAEFGANASYVEDLLRQYQHNPRSVGEEWDEYFSELLNGGNGHVTATTAQATAPTQAVAVAPQPAAEAKPGGAETATSPAPAPVAESAERLQIRGPALKIVENMDASLSVPIATSVRQIQIKLLDENRRWVNRH